MPILASLGTANDRAFGFGDSSFKFAFGRVILSAPVSMEMLLVAGGGSGGGTARDPYVKGGGGGAGGLIHQTTTVAAGTYDVVVGLGGTFGQPTGRSGQNTTAFGLVAFGGGGGGSIPSLPTSGGSGGGASNGTGAAGTSGQGYKGGDQLATGNAWAAGGGGGAGAVGGNAGNATPGGNGGVGLQFDISGELVYYAGGGGGGDINTGTPGEGGLGGGGKGGYTYSGTAGTDGLGGGGGGAGYGGNADYRPAGSGGSGVVILKYLTTEDSKVTLVNGEKATQGEYTICKFTKEYNSVIPDTDYTLPSVITENAAIIYDASNPDSYNASGTTWYDISGNDNHATWSAEPTLAGYNNNQYLIANSSARLTVPSVLTYQDGGFDLIAVWKVTGSLDNINGVGWKSRTDYLDYHLGFDSEGNGGFGGASVDSPGYITSSWGQYVMHWARVGLSGSSTSVTNRVNEGSGGITSGMSYGASGIGSNSCVIGTSGETQLKFLAFYPVGTAPTNINAYNALKGRFGL
jgi:hypothetical protein